MPTEFEKCVSQGGKVRTIKRSSGTYQHICFIGGKSYAGEVKHKQVSSHTGVGKKKKR